MTRTIKVGDLVKVVKRNLAYNEDCKQECDQTQKVGWIPSMNKYDGQILKIIKIRNKEGTNPATYKVQETTYVFVKDWLKHPTKKELSAYAARKL